MGYVTAANAIGTALHGVFVRCSRFLVVLLVMGCRNLSDPDEGAGRAREGHVAFRLAPAVGVATTSGSLALGDLLYTDCEGVEVIRPSGAQVDLGAGTLIALDPGDWCNLQIDLAQPVSVAGITQGGLPWSLELEVLVVGLGNGTPFRILRDRAYLVELGEPGWFRALDLEPEDTAVTSVTVDSGHPSHDELSGALALRSALLVDVDGDTRVDDGERATGVVARGADRTPPGGDATF